MSGYPASRTCGCVTTCHTGMPVWGSISTPSWMMWSLALRPSLW
jgi:hypothetical protein